ncbi:MAG: beta-glucosidase BglX [Bacteroidota bacterium]
MRRHILICLVSLLCLVSSGFSQNNTKRIPEVEALLSQMTLQEKIGQLNLLTPGGGIPTGSVVSKNVEAKIKAAKVGGLFGIATPEKLKRVQDMAVNETRLKIPLIFGMDVIHGYKTTFPIPLGMSSSWDMEWIEKAARIAAIEATADGLNWNFSPMVDIARDPRWGRIAEGAGEDPYLGSAVAQAMVRGYQGGDLGAENTMAACVKHLALYGASEAGRDYNRVDMSRLKMYNEYLPPYKAAADAGAVSMMTSFNDIDGVPASGNKWLLTDLIRDEWNFDGFVVSDYTSVTEMVDHGLGDTQAVSALALNAGLDMEMVGEGMLNTLEKSVREGKVSEQAITQACRRILEAKYKLGLFEDPYRYIKMDRPAKDILTAENRQTAREMAQRSFVLLKNEGGLLPLKENQSVALIGPLANSRNNMLGTWAPTGDLSLGITVLEGFKNVAPETIVNYAKGANISDDPTMAKNVNVFGTRIDISETSSEDLRKEALEVAKRSDVLVLVVGEATEMSGESSSRTNLLIPESQKRLIRTLAALGKPTVLVLMSGRPLNISEEFDLPVSILQVWHPGVEAGNAIVDVLYGKYNPSGKLTASWPRNVGQIPVYHSMRVTGRPSNPTVFQKFRSNFLDAPNTPLFPFGYGLSYTTFKYSDLALDKENIGQGASVTVSVTLKNTGNFDGEEVVQLYLRDVVRSITPPMRTLKGFKKVFIKAGETQKVEITLRPDDLKFYNSSLEFVVEPGVFEVFVGGNSTAELKGRFELR